LNKACRILLLCATAPQIDEGLEYEKAQGMGEVMVLATRPRRPSAGKIGFGVLGLILLLLIVVITITNIDSLFP
jgi:hypothetical protein